jgi:tetratricopeptide (TPR) repeat protein
MNLHASLRLRRAVLRLSFAVSALCPLVAHAEGADAADAAAEPTEVEQARKHFGQGLKLYKDGDFDAALVQFERAYAVKPNFKVLYNIAQCDFELHQYVEARDTLSRYLKDGAGAIDAERQGAVQHDLGELEHRIAHLTVKVNVTGATVFVDGKKAGTTPLAAAIDVNEGQRTVSVETADRGSKQRIVRVGGGEEQTVSVDFAAQAAAPAAAAASPQTERPQPRASRGLGAGFWLTGGFAVALGAGAGVTGYLALKAQDDFDKDLGRFGVSASELNDAHKRAKTFALTTDILAGSAIVCASIATVLLVTHDSGAEQVGLAVGPGNVTLRGNF